MMQVSVRRIGQHRGTPRLYLDTVALVAHGFKPGVQYAVHVDASSQRLRIEVSATGSRRVSKKSRAGGLVPVIDLHSKSELGMFDGHDAVRVVLVAGVLHVLALVSRTRAIERFERLVRRLRAREALRLASVAFGAGITASAFHAGCQDVGVDTELALANEISADYLDIATRNNRLVTQGTVLVNAPMQEAINDAWLLARVGAVDVLELAIPCSGASRAGRSKRGLAKPEDHPDVGHLVGSMLQWIAALQPALVFCECVAIYRDTGSAAILRSWLRDAGYAVSEVVLDARDFGSLEGRIRWFLLASPPGVQVDLQVLARRTSSERPVLADLLDAVPPDDPSWRAVDYLKAKAVRDASEGKGFAMQLVEASAQSVPTLRKGYHKGGSTDPRLAHPSQPGLSRLLTPSEHARVKGIDESLIKGLPSTTAHQLCGQSVDTRPVRAIGRLVGGALRAIATTVPEAVVANAYGPSITVRAVG